MEFRYNTVSFFVALPTGFSFFDTATVRSDELRDRVFCRDFDGSHVREEQPVLIRHSRTPVMILSILVLE